MKPIATACQSGSAGSAWPVSARRRRRQRNSRITNVSVATSTARTSGAGRAPRISWRRVPASVPLSTHHRSSTEMTSPATAGSQRRRAADAALIGGVQRERNQVEQLADERLGRAKITPGAELRCE